MSRDMPKGMNTSFDVFDAAHGHGDVSHKWGHVVWQGTTVRWVPVVWVVPERVTQWHWSEKRPDGHGAGANCSMAKASGGQALPGWRLTVGTWRWAPPRHPQVLEMVPTLQPPPPVKGNESTLNTGLSLGDAIHKLHDAILNIALPKMKTAKTVSIPVETLHLARDLAGSTCTLLREHHTDSQLNDISRQLEAI